MSNTNKQFDQKVVNGFIRRLYVEIPKEIISLIFLFYHLTYELLKFDPKLKADDVILSDDDKCAFKKEQGNVHVLPVCDPVNEGIAVWRVQV